MKENPCRPQVAFRANEQEDQFDLHMAIRDTLTEVKESLIYSEFPRYEDEPTVRCSSGLP